MRQERTRNGKVQGQYNLSAIADFLCAKILQKEEEKNIKIAKRIQIISYIIILQTRISALFIINAFIKSVVIAVFTKVLFETIIFH